MKRQSNAQFQIVEATYPGQQLQEEENRRLIGELRSLLDNAMSVSENYLAYTDGRLAPLSEQGADVVAAAHRLFEQYVHDAPCGWSEATMMERCEQVLSSERIREIGARPPANADSIAEALRQLKSVDQAPRGRLLLAKEALQSLNEHKADDAVVDLPSALVELYDVKWADVTAALREEHAEIKKEEDAYAAQVREAEAVYAAAVSSGNVVEVERAHRHLIAARYEYIVFLAKLLRRVAANEDDSDVNNFGQRISGATKDALDGLAEFRKEKDDLRNAVLHDIAHCEDARKDEVQKHHDALAQYEQQARRLDGELSDIVRKKQVLIEELRQKAAQLRDLMEQQQEVLEAGVAAKIAEAQRASAHNEFIALETQHRDRLQHCLNYANMCDPVAEEIKRYVDAMSGSMPEDDLRKAVTDVTDKESMHFMDAYKAFVFACGDLTVKKTHRLDTLERQARLTQHNRDTAMESLDPNLEGYRTELEELVEQMRAVEGVIAALNATQDAGEQIFESVEPAVWEAYKREGKPFVHPLQEFGAQSVQARQKFVDRAMNYVEGEEKQIYEKRSELANMQSIVDQEGDSHVRAITAKAK